MSWWRSSGKRPRTAAAWFARLQSQEVSATERAQFRQWLEAEPGNQEQFRRSEKLWQLLRVVVRDEHLIDETRRALSSPQDRSPRVYLDRWAVVAAGFALASIATWWAVEHVGVRDVETVVGAQQRIVLADGSRVTLNTASQLRIDYRFGRRWIQLERGEALFDVARDSSHPFVVQTTRTVVTALGTEFAVAKSAQGVEVSVLEGRVRVDAAQGGDRALPAIVLTAGQAGRLTHENREWIRGEADSARIRAWQAERLQFQNETLEAVAAEFNQYSTTALVLEDPRLARLLVSGVFRIGHTESLVRALVEIYPIQAYWQSNRIILRLASQLGMPAQDLARSAEPQASVHGKSSEHEVDIRE